MDERSPSQQENLRGRNYAGIAPGKPQPECMAERQKYWSELKEHERIDRTREVVKRLEGRLEMAEAYIRSLMEHRHDTGGHLLGPFDPSRHMPRSGAWAVAKDGDGRGPDEVYF